MQEKNSVKIKEKKQIQNKRKRAKQNDKIKKKTFVAVFAEYEFDWTTRENLKKAVRKHKKPWKIARKLQKLN